MIRPLAFVFALLSACAPAFAQDVDGEAPWQVCNQTSFALKVATGIMEDGELTVRGWDEVYPGGCLSYAVESDEDRYVLAESLSAYQGGIREWKGNVELCASDDDFEAEPDQSCNLQDLITRRYLRVDGDEERTFLVEPDAYGDKAETAGVQRLLRDAGYRVRRIDGLTGRATNRMLRQFRKDRELPPGLTGDGLFEALIAAAGERRAEVGLNLCNSSSDRIWGAAAFRRDGIWNSRGWWPVEVGECAQLLTDAVDGLSPHLFALQEDTTPVEVDPDDPEPEEPPAPNPDRRLRASATDPSRFCISEARFAAIGRESCRDRGYAYANFRALSDAEAGVSVTLTDADFASPPVMGLRR